MNKLEQNTTHPETIVDLKRIEGQIKGIQKMVEEERYCVDIILQIYAVIKALSRVIEKIFAKHVEHCVVDAFRSKSEKEKQEKIQEIIKIMNVR